MGALRCEADRAQARGRAPGRAAIVIFLQARRSRACAALPHKAPASHGKQRSSFAAPKRRHRKELARLASRHAPCALHHGLQLGSSRHLARAPVEPPRSAAQGRAALEQSASPESYALQHSQSAAKHLAAALRGSLAAAIAPWLARCEPGSCAAREASASAPRLRLASTAHRSVLLRDTGTSVRIELHRARLLTREAELDVRVEAVAASVSEARKLDRPRRRSDRRAAGASLP
jgi:hypothetical protein